MSRRELKEPEANQTSQQAQSGNGAFKNGHSDEAALIKLLMELTGESESLARSAFMFVIRENGEPTTRLTN
jgi:hypothetical protein